MRILCYYSADSVGFVSKIKISIKHRYELERRKLEKLEAIASANAFDDYLVNKRTNLQKLIKQLVK
jgi:hypothetical protein